MCVHAGNRVYVVQSQEQVLTIAMMGMLEGS